jgi:hypothetical protein
MIGVLYCTHDIVQHASAPETVHDSRQTKNPPKRIFLPYREDFLQNSSIFSNRKLASRV